MRRLLPVLMLVMITAGGCASHHKLAEPPGLAKGGLFKDPKDVKALEQALTDKGIARMLDADVRAKLPTNVALAGADGGAGGLGDSVRGNGGTGGVGIATTATEMTLWSGDSSTEAVALGFQVKASPRPRTACGRRLILEGNQIEAH